MSYEVRAAEASEVIAGILAALAKLEQRALNHERFGGLSDMATKARIEKLISALRNAQAAVAPLALNSMPDGAK